MCDPAKTANATYFSQNFNIKALRGNTILNFDRTSSDFFNHITKYDFNISTANTISGI